MNDFNDISEDINWRKEQLLTCKTLPFLGNLTEEHKLFLIKYSIPIIYSLWEGFVQNTFQTYIRELNKLTLSKNHFCDNILLHTLESKFPQFKEYPIDYRKRQRFIVDLDNFMQNQFEITNKVDTESNVALEVLNKLLNKFNLKEIPNHPYKQQLKDLLMYRNRISHGDISMIVDSTNTIEFINKINGFISLIEILMHLVFDNIHDGFNTTKSYLKTI